LSHLDVREEVVREKHRLRALEMGVSRDDDLRIRCGKREQRRLIFPQKLQNRIAFGSEV
jgi:hypothetical protein